MFTDMRQFRELLLNLDSGESAAALNVVTKQTSGAHNEKSAKIQTTKYRCPKKVPATD